MSYVLCVNPLMDHGSTPMQWFVNGFLADFNWVYPPVKIDDQDYRKYLKHIINLASELAKMWKFQRAI